MFKRAVLLALAGSSLLLTAAAPEDRKPAAKGNSNCFLSRDWVGWKPSADSRSIYIHVNVHD